MHLGSMFMGQNFFYFFDLMKIIKTTRGHIR